MIAKDVLAQLDAKRFKPKTGAFVRMTFRKEPDGETQICKIIGDGAPPVNCQACALGAMMMAEIRHTNAIKVNACDDGEGGVYIDRGHEGDRLDSYFSKSQLRLIEIAFERGGGYYRESSIFGTSTVFTKTDKRAQVLFSKASSANKRMRAIMENIVANGGKFVV